MCKKNNCSVSYEIDVGVSSVCRSTQDKKIMQTKFLLVISGNTASFSKAHGTVF